MIIDAHAHIGMKWPELDENVSVDYTIKMMERSNVDMIITSASRMMRSDIVKGNQITDDIINTYPTKVLGYVCADPLLYDKSLEQIDMHMKKQNFKGIKLHISHNGVSYDSELYNDIYDMASQQECLVLAHTFNKKDAETFAKVASKYPKASFIVGHSGGYQWHQLFDVMDNAPDNVYWDLCCSCTHDKRVELLVKHAGADNVVYGSDAPLFPFILDLTQVQNADIRESDKEKILYGNIKNIIGRIN